MAILTTTELSDLCGYPFDEAETRRAKAVIKLVENAAAGVTNRTINFETPPLIVSVIATAAMRMMQNKAGVATETIGSFNAQYPTAGRIFTGDELQLLQKNTFGGYGSIPVITQLSRETYETD
jgi:hypothetical protein